MHERKYQGNLSQKNISVIWTINFNLTILKVLICSIFLSYTNVIEIKEYEAI